MVTPRACKGRNQIGIACGAPPLLEGEFCFWHDPEHADAAAEARRLGGLRRRKEGTIAGAYDFEGLGSVNEIRRLVEIVVTDALSMENSVARGRLILAGATVAAKLREVGEMDERLAAVEAALGPRLQRGKR